MKLTTIEHLIDKQSTAFIGSIDEQGYPNTKAMLAPRKREGLRTFYFTSNTSSMRASQYKKNTHACIYFCDKRFFRGVMLLGEMEVLTDHDSRALIWQDGDTMYYPKGVDDEDYCVLRLTAKQGRTYGNFHSETFMIDDLK